MVENTIRLSKSCLSTSEDNAVLDVLHREYLGMGQDVKEFEDQLSQFFSRPAICVSSGTAALHLSLQALHLSPGDEVLVPSLTYLASFQAISASGATPIACDVLSSSLSIDLDDAASRITRRTKAIMPVHYAGSASSLRYVYIFANKYSLRVVEDSAHAFGSYFDSKLVGSFGDISCFSFDGIKNITCGEGGCIVSSDPEVLQNVSDSRLLGVKNDSLQRYAGNRSWNFDVESQGWRYHMSNINAAIGKVQLSRFPLFSHKRQHIVKMYNDLLSRVAYISCFDFYHDNIVPHIYVVSLSSQVNRDHLRDYLLSLGIQTGLHYPPNHLHSLYSCDYSLPMTEQLFPHLLTLPLHYDLTDSDIIHIVDSLSSYSYSY